MHYSLLHNSSGRSCVISTLESRRTIAGCSSRTLTSLEENILRLTELRNAIACPTFSRENDLRRRRESAVPEFVSGLSFSEDGLLLLASAGGNVHMFDPHRGRLVRSVWEPHENVDIANLCFYSDKKFFYSTTNGCIGLWDARKLDVPLNFYKAHSNSISKVLHDKDTNWLLTADRDGQLHYWYLPAFEVQGVMLQDDHHGCLTSCPTLNQMCMVMDDYESKKLVMTAANATSLYIIDNLDLSELAKDEELKRVSINENLKMYLSMNPKMAYKAGRKNYLHYVDQDEFIPTANANISQISHMESISRSPVIVLRLTTTNIPTTMPRTPASFGQQTKDWTLCLRLKDRPRLSYNLFQSYGLNVMHESLLYSIEEPRFCALKEKRNCISPCNRMIASPQKDGIKLLSFSDRFVGIRDAMESKVEQHFLPGIFSTASVPKTFNEYAHLTYKSLPSAKKAYPLCCKFSPQTAGLLVVGDSVGQVSFYQPRL